MKFFQNRWVAFALCALMIVAAFAIAEEKQSIVVPASSYLDAENTVIYTGSLPSALIEMVSGGVRFGLVSIGILVFVSLISLLVVAAVIMAVVRAAQRRVSDRDETIIREVRRKATYSRTVRKDTRTNRDTENI